MGQNLASAGIYLIQTFIGLYVLMIMIRFLMQISRVDYYNPICQGIVKITDPAIRPFRTVLPTIRGVDFASLTAAFIVQLIGIVMIMLLSGNPLIHPVYFAWVAITSALSLTGCPVVTLPCGLDHAGMPFGIQLVGRPHGDLALLKTAYRLEKALVQQGLGRVVPPL